MYSEVVKLGHKTALCIQSLLLLPSEVRPRPVVKDEAGAPLAPTLPLFLKTLSASWWPESLGVRDMLCVKSALFGVCLSLEMEQARKLRSLGTARLSPRDPNKLSVQWEKKPAGRTKHLAPWSVEQPGCGLTVTHCGGQDTTCGYRVHSFSCSLLCSLIHETFMRPCLCASRAVRCWHKVTAKGH